MSRKFLVPIDMAKGEIQNAAMHNLAGAPSAPVKGQIYFNTTDNILYWWNGSGWVAAQGGAGAVPATTVTTQAVGDAPVVGVATTYAREDHKHGREAFGNVVAETTFGSASGNGSAATVARSDHVHGNPAHNAAAHSTIPISALAAATADVSMGGFRLTNVASPGTGTDAVTKDYVDNLQAGLSWKDSVKVATTASITLSGTQTIDGVAVVNADRVLVKNQTTAEFNGIYVVSAGAWSRSTDADSGSEIPGTAVFVEQGTSQQNTAWVLTTDPPISLNSTALTFVQFGAGTAYSAGNGLTLTGSTFDVVPLNGSIVVAADSVSVGYAGTGAAVTAARSDHNHDAAYAPIAHNHDGVYTKKFSANCAAATSTVVTHNLNTRDVLVNVYRSATPWDTVECDVERTDANNVTVRFSVAPAASEYRIVVTG